jgi:hypothetical protein
MLGLRRWSYGLAVTLCLALGGTQVGPPVIAGVALGLTPARVQGILGQPQRRDESLGMRFWEYPQWGVTLIWREGMPGVHGIVANSAAAGAVREVRVGDSEAVLRRRWGTPARVRQTGRFLDFVGAGWVLSAELREKKVVQITLMAAVAAAH